MKCGALPENNCGVESDAKSGGVPGNGLTQ